MKNIENIAVISGASSGIGEAIAKELAKNNITVCLGARSIKKLDKIVDQMEADNGGLQDLIRLIVQSEPFGRN